jgi:hypothetical protein
VPSTESIPRRLALVLEDSICHGPLSCASTRTVHTAVNPHNAATNTHRMARSISAATGGAGAPKHSVPHPFRFFLRKGWETDDAQKPVLHVTEPDPPRLLQTISIR